MIGVFLSSDVDNHSQVNFSLTDTLSYPERKLGNLLNFPSFRELSWKLPKLCF